MTLCVVYGDKPKMVCLRFKKNNLHPVVFGKTSGICIFSGTGSSIIIVPPQNDVFMVSSLPLPWFFELLVSNTLN